MGHGPVGDGEHDVDLYVYATEAELEAEVAEGRVSRPVALLPKNI